MGEASGSGPAPLEIRPARAERAARRALQIPLRFRMKGQQGWSVGETVNLSSSGLLFSSETLLEIGTTIEVTFQMSSMPLLGSSMIKVRIVRRVLNNWPEVRPIFGAKFL
jgi:PilZ domain